MPRGSYVRTEAQKQRLREVAARGRETAIRNGNMGKYVRTDAHRKVLSEKAKNRNLKGDKSPLWKGDAIGISGVHYWMKKNFGMPSLCENCGTAKAGCFDWANISGQYKRDRSDWKRLCRSCHMRSDGRGPKAVRAMHQKFQEKVHGDINWLMGG